MSDVGFEPTSANTRALEAPPLDQTLVIRLCRQIIKHLSGAGFEPASANTRALKAPPLDQALVTRLSAYIIHIIVCRYILLIHIYMRLFFILFSQI